MDKKEMDKLRELTDKVCAELVYEQICLFQRRCARVKLNLFYEAEVQKIMKKKEK